MKRPLILLGLAVMGIAMVRNGAEEPKKRALLRFSQTQLLTAAQADGGRVTLTGTVRECRATSGGTRFSIDQISILQNDNSEQSLAEQHKIIFTIEETTGKEIQTTEDEPAKAGEGQAFLAPGDAVTVSGGVRTFDPAGNPGQFDMEEYYYRQNIVCGLGKPELLGVRPQKLTAASFLYRVRALLRASSLRVLEEEDARTVSAVGLGEKAWMDGTVKELYQESGIAHIASVSGLHVSLVGMSLYELSRRWLLGIGPAGALAGTVTILYTVLTGGSVSAIRACVMFLIWLLAQAAGRKYDRITAAFAALAVILSGAPSLLTDSSFLLSFGAVFSLAALVPALEEDLLPGKGEKRGAKKAGGIRSVLSRALRPLIFSLGLWLGMLPVTLYFFYQTPLWSFLLNLAVVPLMPAVMGFGLLGCLAGLVSVPLGSFLAAPVHYILALFEFLCGLELRLPGNLWVAGRPAAPSILLYYGAILSTALLCRRSLRGGLPHRKGSQPSPRSFRPCAVQHKPASPPETGRRADSSQMVSPPGAAKILLWLGCIGLCVLLMGSRGPKTMEILCLDVGQGDSAMLRMPTGEVYLIDGGSSTESQVWTYRISQALKYYGEGELDGIFLSHADADHINGVEEYLEAYERGFDGKNIHGITCRRLILPPTGDEEDFASLIALAREKGIEVLKLEAGDVLESRALGKSLLADQARAAENPGAPGTAAGDLPLWSFTCLAPHSSSLTGDKNQDSMVLLFRYGSFRMLFTGDLEKEAELSLARSGKDLEADVLKVGHHGSKNASSGEFLRAVRPAVSVISCGKDNRYGHPSAETMARLTAAGCGIYETDQNGAVRISATGAETAAVTYFFNKNIKN